MTNYGVVSSISNMLFLVFIIPGKRQVKVLFGSSLKLLTVLMLETIDHLT